MKTLNQYMKKYKKLYAAMRLIKNILINIIIGVYFLIAMIFITLDMEGTYTVIGLVMLILLALTNLYIRSKSIDFISLTNQLKGWYSLNNPQH